MHEGHFRGSALADFLTGWHATHVRYLIARIPFEIQARRQKWQREKEIGIVATKPRLIYLALFSFPSPVRTSLFSSFSLFPDRTYQSICPASMFFFFVFSFLTLDIRLYFVSKWNWIFMVDVRLPRLEMFQSSDEWLLLCSVTFGQNWK